jgi:hypothetical protein
LPDVGRHDALEQVELFLEVADSSHTHGPDTKQPIECKRAERSGAPPFALARTRLAKLVCLERPSFGDLLKDFVDVGGFLFCELDQAGPGPSGK